MTPTKQLTLTQKRETCEALDLIEGNLHIAISREGGNWCASACLRLLKQLKKTIAPLVEPKG